MAIDPGISYDIPSAVVEYRASLGDSWIRNDNLRVDRIHNSIGGGFGSATFSWHYGLVKNPDDPGLREYFPLEIDRFYAHVQFTPNSGSDPLIDWYGIVISSRDERLGLDASNLVTAGNQTFQAVTLDWLLTRKQITSSVIHNVPIGTTTIQRGITFNAAEGDQLSGPEKWRNNRSTIKITDAFGFVENLRDGAAWSAYDILQYLLAYHQPTADTGGFELDLDDPSPYSGSDIELALNWFYPVVKTDGRTLYDVLNSLIDQRRGLSWSSQYDDTSQVLLIKVHTYNQLAITLPGAATELPPNDRQLSINVDLSQDASSSLVVTDSQRKYEQVKAVGAFKGACFTIGYGDSTIKADWSGAQQTTYVTGDTSATGDLSRKRADHDIFRSGDQINHVFTRFRVPEDWDGKAGDGISAAQAFVFPALDPDGDLASPSATEVFWIAGLRFKNWLPFLENHDETDPTSRTNNAPADTTSGPRRPFATHLLGGKRYYAHLMGLLADDETTPESGSEANCRVKMAENMLGVHVIPMGYPPHYHGVTHFSPTGGSAEDSSKGPVVDWQDMTVTVFAECDTRLEVSWPDPSEPAVTDTVSILYIRVGERARLDFVPANTIWAIEDGVLKKTAPSGFIRDDRDLLKDISRTAWEWHQLERNAISVTLRQLTSEWRIGDLVTTYGEALGNQKEVNAIVTSIDWDFLRGITTLRTDFADIQFANFA